MKRVLLLLVPLALWVGVAAAAKPLTGPDKPGWSVSVREAAPFLFTQQVHLDFSAPQDYVWGNVSCYQNGLLVYSEYNGFFEGYYEGPDPPFTLGPTNLWQSGPAECVASVGDVRRGAYRPLAFSTFTAG